MALVMHREDAFIVETSFSSFIDTLILGSRDPLALAFFDEAPLHLSHHTKDGEDHVSELSTR